MACLHEKELWDNRWCPVTCFYCTGDQKRRCKHNKATNADRIRAMNDEELIKLLTGFCTCNCIFPYKNCEHKTCEECFKEWLQSPEEKGGE